jgi:hypothetical protein
MEQERELENRLLNNPGITSLEAFEYYIEYELESKDLSDISRNTNITMEFVKKYKKRGYKWDYYWLSRNPHLTIDFISETLNEKYDWTHVSSNPNITLDDILEHDYWPWSWYYVSCNPNITMEMIERHPEVPWNWKGIILNPNLFPTTNGFYKKYAKYKHLKFIQRIENPIKITKNLYQRHLIKEMHILREIFIALV